MYYKTHGAMQNYRNKPSYVTYFYVPELAGKITYYEILCIWGFDAEYLGSKEAPMDITRQWESCTPPEEIKQMFEEAIGEKSGNHPKS